MFVYFTFRNEPVITDAPVDQGVVYEEKLEELETSWFTIRRRGQVNQLDAQWELVQFDFGDHLDPYVVAEALLPIKLLVVLARRATKYGKVGEETLLQLLEWASE